MRSLLFVVVLAVSCAHSPQPSPGAGGGVSLSNTWVPDLVEAQPASQYMTRAQADARYLKLTGGTLTGTLTGPRFVATGAGGISYVTPAGDGQFVLSNAGTTWGIWSNSSQGQMNFVVANGTAFQIINGTGVVTGASYPFSSGAAVTAATYVKSTGVATGSLPTCNAGQFGTFENDTTADTFRECNDNAIDGLDAWRPVLKGSTSGNGNQQNLFLGFYRSGDVVVTEAVDFMGMGVSGESADAWNALAGQPATISCSWETTGVVGGASVGVAMELSDGTETCNCALGAGATECDATVRTNLSCDCTWSGTNGARLSAMTAGNKGIKLQMKNTTDCGTNPRNVQCTAYTRWGPL